MEIAYLALGGNIGDVEASIIAALKALDMPPIIELVACSSIYRTEPVGGPPGQADYLNAAAKVETELTPRELLSWCIDIERALGRERKERWGARTIDIDILLYGATQIREDDLTIPHSRMRDRLFVLMPLSEIAPASLALGQDGSQLGQVLDEALGRSGTTREWYRQRIVLPAPDLCQ